VGSSLQGKRRSPSSLEAGGIVGVCALLFCWAGSVSAQTLPDSPIVLADRNLTISGSVAASFGSEDLGFFNYTEYERSVLRTVRLELTAALTAGRHVTVLGALRSDNGERPIPHAFYVRLRPWAERPFDIQVGRVPQTFGSYSRRTYAVDNPLIGYPLGYQYLTSLRADAVPRNADELVGMRGRGWLSSFSVGEPTPMAGVPLVSAFRWDTGVQVHAGGPAIDGTISVTTGTPARPLVRDDNGRPQVAGRLEVRPVFGLVLGASASRGPFVGAAAARAATGGETAGAFTQTAWGVDAEYARGHYLMRLETIVSRWTLPLVGEPRLRLPLTATAVSVEGRYKVAPGVYAAARLDRLGFSHVTGSAGRASWDAPVTRVEVGGGYSLQRNLLLKLAYQHNVRDGGRVRRQSLGAAQLVFWF